MTRAADALQQGRDRARRTELADQVDIADVDAELQRRRGHEHLELGALEALLGVEAQFAGQAAMVGGDMLLAETFAEMACGAFGHASRVDEDQGRAVRLDQPGEAVVDRLPDLVRHHRLERHRRHLDGEVARAHVATVDDRTVGHAPRIDMAGADQEPRNLLDRLLRGRQADAGQAALAQRFEAFEAQGQVAAALAVGNRVDLVDDHRARAGQHQAPRFRAEQQVQRLGRRDEDLRRALQHALAFGGRRVAGAHASADLELAESTPREFVANAGQRCLEIDRDVVGQRLQRRNIDDRGLLGQAAGEALAHEPVDRGEERGQGLAGTGRRRDQGMPAGTNRRPGIALGRRRGGEGLCEPRRNGRMEGIEGGRSGHRYDMRRLAWKSKPTPERVSGLASPRFSGHPTSH